MTPRKFIEILSKINLPDVFNPYSQRCPLYDLDDAPKLRRENLYNFLSSAMELNVDTIWVARDLGYRGGRRTGVALTDEVHLDNVGRLLGGARFARATHGPIVAERTAAVVWGVIDRIAAPVVLWNVFPFHPYETNDPLSNRCHTRTERNITLPLLVELIKMLKVKRVVTIGRDAQNAIQDIEIPYKETVRHPSYGGQTEFINGLNNIYGICQKEGRNAYPLFNNQAAFRRMASA